MGLKIINAGLLTTVQDLGRYGFQKEGVIVSGAMDAFALRVANLLVGNPEGAAGIEATFLGPKIRFEADHLIALTGGDLSPTINGESVKMWRPIVVTKGCQLEFGAPGQGCRVYLAVSGSIDIPPVMGSRSTYLRAELGGLKGRALKAGDLLPAPGATPTGRRLAQHLAGRAPEPGSWVQARWTPAPELCPRLEEHPTIRAIKGPEYNMFVDRSHHEFWHEEFIVTSDSDRMGYRLHGPALSLKTEQELVSSAVTFGTIQVPADGHPIALLADHQTTGGYPRLAQAITADFSKLAQVPLGKKLRFQEVSLEEAQYLYIRQEQDIEQIKRSLAFKTLPA
jgi:antagonist of KipI